MSRWPLHLVRVGSASLGLALTVRGDNPIIVDQGVTDPKVRIYGDTAYLYATHDASPTSRKFLMNDWWTWSSNDLVHWKYESTLKPEQTYWGKPSNECWATDAISANGKYYFYFSRGSKELGVVESDSPIGPWTDPIHKPLVAAGSVPTAARDPSILQEPDGTTYLTFGCWDYYIVKLNPDMVSLAETPRLLQLDRKMGPYGPGKTDDKSFLHEYHGKYYLSWGCFYAMSDNVYGPYTYKDCFITKERTAPEFQKGLVFDRHGSFFQLHHQWYFACNDQSWPGTSPHYRDAIISYVHYHDDGTIDPIFIDRTGVGQYDGTQRIEAENYFNAEGATQGECPEGGFELRGLHNGSWVEYPNVTNLPARATASFRYSSSASEPVTVELHDGTLNGPLLGTCRLPGTGGWGTYQTVSAPLANTAGTHSLYLVIRGGPGELLRLNWLSFLPIPT